MWCERLALLPVKAHLVFDGKQRPRLKREKNVRGTDHWLSDPFKSILDIFSLSHSQALGEAEVESACMSRVGVIDSVFTEDSEYSTGNEGMWSG